MYRGRRRFYHVFEANALQSFVDDIFVLGQKHGKKRHPSIVDCLSVAGGLQDA